MANRVRAYRSFPCAPGNPALLTAELRQLISSKSISRRAVVAVWGLRSGHHHMLLPPADPADLGALARREAAATSGVAAAATGSTISDGVLVGGLCEAPTGGTRREVCYVTAPPDEIRARIQPIIDAGFSIERVVTPAVAHAAMVRLRPGSNPGAVTSVLSVNSHVTGITVVRDGAVLFAREMPWGHDTAAAEPGGSPADPAQLAARLAAELRRSLLYVKQNLRVDATQVLVCGDMPELRTLTAPLMHELNMDVETIDSIDGLDLSRLASLADDFRDRASEFRPALVVAADPSAPVNLMPRETVASGLAVPADLRQRMAAGLVTGVLLSLIAFGVIWWMGRSVQSQLTDLRRSVTTLEPQLRALEERQRGAVLTAARRAALDAMATQGPRLARVLELVGRSAPAELAVSTLKVEPHGATWTMTVDGEAVAARPADAQATFGTFLLGLTSSPLLGAPSKPASFRMTSGTPADSRTPAEVTAAEGDSGIPLGVDYSRLGPRPMIAGSNAWLEREIADPKPWYGPTVSGLANTTVDSIYGFRGSGDARQRAGPAGSAPPNPDRDSRHVGGRRRLGGHHGLRAPDRSQRGPVSLEFSRQDAHPVQSNGGQGADGHRRRRSRCLRGPSAQCAGLSVWIRGAEVNTDLRPVTSALSRSAMAIVSIAIAVLAYFWFIQPRISVYVLGRNEVRTQQARVQALQDAIARGARLPQSTDTAFVAEFNRRMSADDQVSEIIAAIARSLSSGDMDKRVRGLLIEAGERRRVNVPVDTGDLRSDVQPRVAQSAAAEPGAIPAGDPRAQLFAGPLLYTPVAVSFESDFEAVGAFLWNLRDAPTVVEVSALTIERGLPLMKVRAQLLVYQRVVSTDGAEGSGSPRTSSAMAPDELGSNQAVR